MMASPAEGHDVPKTPPRAESERAEPPRHPEPACQEAQKWIEAVTGKSFGDKDFRSGLENGILLCELLSAIKPGLVKKINRLPTPIAGLDNLSVFLRGCEELGLKGAQLFDPGDLQDTSIRANLKDSDCNRKLKNVLNTVFWLGKAASSCTSYSGPALNLKEFEGLLAQMKVESEEGGEGPQKRGVRDSGYDCWDSERSESLSPPRHTRDNSLDSLDSFGSRSQHSPSPDVVNRGTGDGRGSDSEIDAQGKRPDVRKDDMSARRTVSNESRSTIPFNQFLPNRTNASSYIPAPRRRPHTEEGEQRSHPQATTEQGKSAGVHHKAPKTVTWAAENNGENLKQEEERVTEEVLEHKRLQKWEKAGIKVLPAAIRYSSPPPVEDQGPRSPSPNIILRSENEFLSSQSSSWDPASDEEEDAGMHRVPDVRRDDLASRRAHRGPVAPNVHQFVPSPVCSNKDRERWEGIRRSSQKTLQEKEISEREAMSDIITRSDNPLLNPAPHREDEEREEEQAETGSATPNRQKDDLAQRRTQSRPLPHREGPTKFVAAHMSQADMQKWERLKMTELSEDSSTTMPQACLQKNYGSSFSGSAKAGRGHNKVVTFGGVTEIQQPIDTSLSSEGEETELLRRLLSKATVAMPTIDLVSQRSERERRQVDGNDLNHASPPSADLPSCTSETPLTRAELDARLAQYEQRAEEDEDEEEEERAPDLQKDDMMARRTGVFHRQSTMTYNRFLPLPTSVRGTQGEATTDAAPRSKKQVQADRNKMKSRAEHQQPKVPMETPQSDSDLAVVRGTSHREHENDEEDEYGENDPVPDLEKDDMMARRTGLFQKNTAPRANQSIKQFLPVPGSVKYSIAPVSAMKPLNSRPKYTEKVDNESVIPSVQAAPQPPSSKLPTLPVSVELNKRQDEDRQQRDMTISNTSVSNVPPLSPPSHTPSISPAATSTCNVVAKLDKQRPEEKVVERVGDMVEESKTNMEEEPRKKPFWLDDDDLPPMMMSRRVVFMSEETQSVSMGDIINEDEMGHSPSLSQSRHERMHEQYNNFVEEEEHWQGELTRWKNRRRSASQELIKKEEERKKMEKRMKEEGSDINKRKSIKTYKEIVEDKERREIELCEAYRNAASPEEATMVLQRYALRFTISDATLDSLKLPRSTSGLKQDTNHMVKEEKTTAAARDSETSELQHKPVQPKAAKSQEMKIKPTVEQLTPASSSPVTQSENVPPRSLQLQSSTAESPSLHQKQGNPEEKRSPTICTATEITQMQPDATHPAHTLPSPSSATPRPVPLLAAKPYCQPRNSQPGHKPVKMDGLVRVNGEVMEDLSVSTPVSSSPEGPQETTDLPPAEKEDLATAQPATKEETGKRTPPPQTDDKMPPSRRENLTTFSGSAISSLLGGRNCITTTTIVTELTQTRVEPHYPPLQGNGQVNGAPVPSERPVEIKNSLQEYSPTVTEGLEETSVTEQYRSEQEKLKKEWEKAQLEVEEEERKHIEEERRILEETVTHLTPTGLAGQQLGQTTIVSSAPGTNENQTENAPLQENGHKMAPGNEDQHASKLHFFLDSASDAKPLKKQELWKTASLDRNPQLNQAQVVKRSESHDAVSEKQQSPLPSPQPPSPSRCVSGKRLCSGCSQPLEKGAAMIIDTLGLFFHMQCFKCGVCNGQLGDTTKGTDVRIRNGLLSCYECYIASRGRGQPTTL
ncbi:LIM and calponin homology domains-containing protein 1-like isoform X5 [Takifugu flavidus]|uniref:LIM and calponin homology domains-containing protein 1-like isoform X5 n=1 Tax=Takifugu flavidus TaxID=433684 RepID=UPI002544B821|nr:LIM and calponin homology domains-containing protein 1-like isoform X5 [Takifugu flavidus]